MDARTWTTPGARFRHDANKEGPVANHRASSLGEKQSARALPGLAAAEHAAEGAALDLERIGAFQRDRGVVIAAAVGIMDPAGPLAALGLHVDQDSCAGVDGIAAQIGAAFLDANVALVL